MIFPAHKLVLGQHQEKESKQSPAVSLAKVIETGVWEGLGIQTLQARWLEICRGVPRVFSWVQIYLWSQEKNYWKAVSRKISGAYTELGTVSFSTKQNGETLHHIRYQVESLNGYTLVVELKQSQSKGYSEPTITKLKIQTQKDQTDSKNLILSNTLSNIFQASAI